MKLASCVIDGVLVIPGCPLSWLLEQQDGRIDVGCYTPVDGMAPLGGTFLFFYKQYSWGTPRNHENTPLGQRGVSS